MLYRYFAKSYFFFSSGWFLRETLTTYLISGFLLLLFSSAHSIDHRSPRTLKSNNRHRADLVDGSLITIINMFSRFRSKISKPKNGNKIAVEPSSKLNRKTERQNTTNTVTVGNKKMVSLSDMKPCVKTASPEIENARVLRRSDTFLVDEDYPVGYTAGKTGTIKGYDTPNYKTFTRNKGWYNIPRNIFECGMYVVYALVSVQYLDVRKRKN